MTSKEIQLPAAAAGPDRIGQATAVEQSRAIAEVQGAIIVAQKVPRNVAVAIKSMTESCSQMYLAERSQFRFPRGGSMVSGTSVYLARELARCWGNMQYGVSELRRDDAHGQSEMMAYAWDVQTNTRVETKFVVVHVRDSSKGTTKLVDQRDIYENNANNGARRVRETILSVLPPWFVDQAKVLCAKTLKDGGGVPLPKRVAAIIVTFEELGVTQQQLEKKQGRGSNAWTELDVAQLTVIGRSLRNGEAKREDEFEPDIPTAAELGEVVPAQEPAPVVSPVAAAPEPTAAEPPAAAEEPPVDPGTPTTDAGEQGTTPAGDPNKKASGTQRANLVNLLNDNEVKSRDDQLAVISLLCGDRVAGLNDLTDAEAVYLLNRIPTLVAGGTFGESVERAKQDAKA